MKVSGKRFEINRKCTLRQVSSDIEASRKNAIKFLANSRSINQMLNSDSEECTLSGPPTVNTIQVIGTLSVTETKPNGLITKWLLICRHRGGRLLSVDIVLVQSLEAGRQMEEKWPNCSASRHRFVFSTFLQWLSLSLFLTLRNSLTHFVLKKYLLVNN